MSMTPPTVQRPARPCWLSIREYAEVKGVNPKTVRAWIANGYLQAERVGPRLIRIPASELDRIGTRVGAA